MNMMMMIENSMCNMTVFLFKYLPKYMQSQ
jgi:hypothetical protein